MTLVEVVSILPCADADAQEAPSPQIPPNPPNATEAPCNGLSSDPRSNSKQSCSDSVAPFNIQESTLSLTSPNLSPKTDPRIRGAGAAWPDCRSGTASNLADFASTRRPSTVDLADSLVKPKELEEQLKWKEQQEKQLEEQVKEIEEEAKEIGIKSRPSFWGSETPDVDLSTTSGKIILLQWHVYRVLSNQKFDACIGIVILLNSVTIGIVSTFEVKNKYGSPEERTDLSVYAALEHVYLFIYTMELLMRFFAMGLSCLKSGWVVFDLVLVLLSAVTSWIIEPILVAQGNGAESMEALAPLMVFRVMRLLRLARSLRLMVQFKTLWMLVSGLLSSAGTMLYTFGLMFLILYVFACLGVELITKDDTLYHDEVVGPVVQEYFSNVSVIMLTLIQFITMDSIGAVYTPIVHREPYLITYFLLFLVLVSISLMNLVTAVLTQGAIEQSKRDTEVQKAYENQRVVKLVPYFKRLFEEMDEDGNGTLSFDELENAPEEVKKELEKVIQTDQMALLFELLDTDCSGEISLDEFIDGLTRMITTEEPMEFIRLRKQIQQIRYDQRELREAVFRIDENVQNVQQLLEQKLQ